MDNDTQEVTVSLADALTDEHKALVERGIYSVHPGKDYPVLRWAAGPQYGQLAPGTGQPPGAGDIGEISKRTAYKRTTQYRELMEKYLPADLDDAKRGTLGWILKQGLEAIEGGDVTKEVECPKCEHTFRTTMWKKPDSNAMKLILEALIGRADVQKDININSEQIYRIIDERTEMKDLRVFDVSPQEQAKREAVDTEWRELSGGM